METSREDLVPSFIVDMINNYSKYYLKLKKKKNKGDLFEGIDFDDPTSTNFYLEDFYRHMENYKINQRINPDFIKIYDVIDEELVNRINNDNNEWFVISRDDNILYASQSLFSLIIEFTNLKNENEDLEYSISKI